MIKYLLLLMLLVGCAPKPFDSCGTQTTIYGQRIKWQEVPVNIVIGNLPENLAIRTVVAAEKIEAIVGKKLFKFLYVEEATSPAFDYVNSLTYGKLEAGTQGQTKMYWNGYGEMREADIIISPDYSYYSERKDVTRSMIREVNFDNLITHELMHFLGFIHSKDPNDIIYPYIAYDQDKVLSEQEIKNIKCVYGDKND